jgi:hypothetical protein
VLDALRADNWLMAHGDDVTPALRADVRATMEAAFVGRDAAWQQAVLEQGFEICQRALAGLRDATDATRGVM